MKKLFTPIPVNPDDDTETFELPLPTQCPNCSIAYSADPLISYCAEPENFYGDSETSVYALYFCPHCEHLFLVHYHVPKSIYFSEHIRTGYIAHTYPTPTEKTDFTNHIRSLSSKFVEIYQQSERAENDGLTEICGMGYRKALEYLVKDFAIHTHPDQRHEIESPKLTLGQCIDKYIDSQKIKTMAKASSWIGNDETHYTRKHEDYDVQDLKCFIKTTAAFIEYELNFEEAVDFLNPEQSKKADSIPK